MVCNLQVSVLSIYLSLSFNYFILFYSAGNGHNLLHAFRRRRPTAHRPIPRNAGQLHLARGQRILQQPEDADTGRTGFHQTPTTRNASHRAIGSSYDPRTPCSLVACFKPAKAGSIDQHLARCDHGCTTTCSKSQPEQRSGATRNLRFGWGVGDDNVPANLLASCMLRELRGLGGGMLTSLSTCSRHVCFVNFGVGWVIFIQCIHMKVHYHLDT